MTPAPSRASFVALSAAAAAVFWLSPVRDVTDSRYVLLVGTNLLRHGELALDRYFDVSDGSDASRRAVKVVPVAALSSHPPRRLPFPHYTVERVEGHVQYFFPHAGAVLALPYLAAAQALGVSVLDGQGRYLARNEERLQAALAALLMGLTTGVFFRTARELLPPYPSALVALVAALGTQVWSTASRVLWSDTWGLTLLSVVVWVLVAARARGRPIQPVWLGSLLAWSYFVRPTNSVHAALTLAYLALAHRSVLPRVVAAGAGWGAAFAAYSYATFGTALPSYFQGGRLGLGYAVEALLANVASPSRGILFYVPVVPLALVLLWRYWPYVRERRLAFLGVAGIAGQFLPLLFFDHWWGGYSYGPRLLTGLVPWAVLVGILAMRARLDGAHGRSAASRRVERYAAAVVCAWSVAVHARGALAADVGRWNVDPVDVDVSPSRVWDWRRPQFLSGLGRKRARPLHLGVPIPVGRPEADGLFGGGWSSPEGAMRWSIAGHAALRIRWPVAGPLLLRLQVRPAPVWAAAGGQPLALWLDGRELARWRLAEPGPVMVTAAVPSEGPDEEHHLELRVPDLPRTAGPGGDARPLRTGLYTIRIDPFPVLPRGERLSLGTDAASRFVGNGWGDPEGSHRWTVAPRADLYFASREPAPAVLRLRLHPFLAEGREPGQRVILDLNGTIAASLALRSEGASDHALPLLDVAGANALGLELPDAASPFGQRLDPRRLGVAVHWLALEPFAPLVPGRPVALAHPDASAYVGEGWAEPEGATRWSVGMKSELLFAVERPGACRLLLTLEPFSSRRHPRQRVRIDLNDHRLGELLLDRPGLIPRPIAVPAGVMRTHNVLRLVLPDARSPASVGQSADRRVLGVRILSLELRPE